MEIKKKSVDLEMARDIKNIIIEDRPPACVISAKDATLNKYHDWFMKIKDKIREHDVCIISIKADLENIDAKLEQIAAILYTKKDTPKLEEQKPEELKK